MKDFNQVTHLSAELRVAVADIQSCSFCRRQGRRGKGHHGEGGEALAVLAVVPGGVGAPRGSPASVCPLRRKGKYGIVVEREHEMTTFCLLACAISLVDIDDERSETVERGDQEETDQGRQWCTKNVAPSGSWQGDSKTYLGAIY